MKRTGFITLLILSLNIVFVTHAQNNKNLLFDEINISVNRTFFNDTNTTNKYGFGIGIFHSWFSPKTLNLTFGFDYNKTNQKKDYIHAGYKTYYEYITYTINTFSFVLLFKVNFGRRIRLFFETGPCCDVVWKVNEKGKMTRYGSTGYIDRDASGFNLFDYALIAGIGIKIPVKKIVIILKTDYHYDFKNHNYVNNNYGKFVIGLKYNYSN